MVMFISWTIISTLVVLISAQHHHQQQHHRNQGVHQDGGIEPSQNRRTFWPEDLFRTSRKTYFSPSFSNHHAPYYYEPPPTIYHHHHGPPPPFHHHYHSGPPPPSIHHFPSRPFTAWSGETFDGNFYPVPGFDPFCNSPHHNTQFQTTTDSIPSSQGLTTTTIQTFQPVPDRTTDVNGLIYDDGGQQQSTSSGPFTHSQLSPSPPSFVTDNQLISGVFGQTTSLPNQPQFVQQPQTSSQTRPQFTQPPPSNVQIITSRPPNSSGVNIGSVVSGVFPGFDQQQQARPGPSRRPQNPQFEIPGPVNPSANINNIIAGIFPGIDTQNIGPIPSRQPTISNEINTQEVISQQPTQPPRNIIAGVFPNIKQPGQEVQAPPPPAAVNGLISGVFGGLPKQNDGNSKTNPNGNGGLQSNQIPSNANSIPVFQPNYPPNRPTPAPMQTIPTNQPLLPTANPKTSSSSSNNGNGSDSSGDEPVFDIDIRFDGGADEVDQRKRSVN